MVVVSVLELMYSLSYQIQQMRDYMQILTWHL